MSILFEASGAMGSVEDAASKAEIQSSLKFKSGFLLPDLLYRMWAFNKETTDFINFLEKKKTSKKGHFRLNGRNEPINKSTTGGGNKNFFKTDFAREFIPIQRTRLAANTRNHHGHKNGSSVSKHFHDGENWKANRKIKALPNRSFGNVTWRNFLPLEHHQRLRRTVHGTRK